MTQKNEDIVATGKWIVSQALKIEGDWGMLANELLNLCYRGFSVEELAPLFEGKNITGVLIGLFLVDELGGDACALFDTVAKQVNCSNSKVRYEAYKALYSMSGKKPVALQYVFRGLFDSDAECRKIATLLLMRSHDAMLTDAFDSSDALCSNPVMTNAWSKLIDLSAGNSRSSKALDPTEDPSVCRLEVIAAGRSLLASYKNLLELCQQETVDSELAECIQTHLNYIELKHKKLLRFFR